MTNKCYKKSRSAVIWLGMTLLVGAMSCNSIAQLERRQDGTNRTDESKQEPNSEREDFLDRAFTKTVQEQIGIQKLSQEERAALSAAVREIVAIAADEARLNRSARRYLELQGWEVVTVLGTRRAQLERFGRERDWLIVDTGLETWAIEEPFISAFAPGRYWAKVSPLGGIDSMLDTSGREEDFLLAKSHRLGR